MRAAAHQFSRATRDCERSSPDYLFSHSQKQLRIRYGKDNVTRLKSASGARQGDPLGPFLFSLAIHPVLQDVQKRFESHGVKVLAYIDDIYILGPATKALEAFRALKAGLATLNLEASTDPGKCWVHCQEEELYAFMTAPEHPVAAPASAAPEGEPTPFGFRLQKRRTYKVLGVHCGAEAATKTKEAVNNTSKPKSLSAKLAALRDFGDGGYASLAAQLLLSCAAPSVNYALRASDPEASSGMAAEADLLLRNTFAALAGVDPDELAPGKRAGKQLRMRQSDGGVGLASVETLAKTAHLASWAACGPLIAQRWPDLADTIAALNDPTSVVTLGSFAAKLAVQRKYCEDELGLGDMLAKDLAFVHADPPAADGQEAPAGTNRRVPPSGHKWQKRFAAAEAARAKAAFEEEVEDAVGTSKDPEAVALAAWHKSLAADGRAAFLHSMPTAWQPPPANHEFAFAIHRLLRLELRHNGMPVKGTRCPCGAIIDAYGDHADGCKLLVWERGERHRRVNEEGIFAPARQAKLSPSTETPGLVEDSNGRPADTGIKSGHGFGAAVHACYDCVGVGTCAKSYVKDAARWTGAAWNGAVKRKLENAVVLKGTMDLLVIPMAFESQGGLHPNWQVTYVQWARRWGEQAEDRPRWRQGLVVRAWIARTSLVIQREQCRSVARMVDRAARKTHCEIPRKHSPLRTDDHDCAQVAQPPLEVE